MSGRVSNDGASLRLLILADGRSIHTERWLRGLAAAGPASLSLITMNPEGVREGIRQIPELDGIDEIYAGRINPQGGNWRYLLNLPRVMRVTRRRRPDVIIAIYLTSYGLLGALAKGDAALAHVMIGSDVMVTPWRSALLRLLARRTVAAGDLLVCASRAMTEALGRLAAIPSGVVLTQQYGVEDWIIEHPRRERTYEVVSNRAWVPNSRILQLLRIFHSVDSPGPLALVGGGGPQSEAILGQAAGDPRVHPLGLLSHEENLDVVARSSFYFSMTESDGASLSLMEAMAVGTIPVVSDIEPNREWVDHEVNGFLVPLDDDVAAARILEWARTCPAETLDAMRARNRAIIRERGSLTRNMARFRGRLVEVLAARTEGRR